jgi:hypothetical protein
MTLPDEVARPSVTQASVKICKIQTPLKNKQWHMPFGFGQQACAAFK